MSLFPRRWWLVLPLCVLVLLLAHGMALIYRIQPAVSLWFPPSGVAIALTFWFGPIGAVLTGVTSILMAPLWGSDDWTRIVGITDATEPLVAWWLYRRYFSGSLLPNRLRDAAAFTLSGPLAACATSAVVGSVALVVVGKMPLSNLAMSIPHWWLGNAMGTLAIAPTALLVLTPFLQNWGWLSSSNPPPEQNFVKFSPSRCLWAEVAAILVFLVSTAALTVSKTQSGGFAFQQFSFLSFVPIIWAAIRFGVLGGMLTSSFCVLVTLLAYLFAYPNAISLANFPVPAEVLHVHKISLLVQCAVSLFVGCATTERAATQVALAVEGLRTLEYEARAQLSAQLIQLNDELKEANRRLEQSNCDKDELLLREQVARADSEAARRAAESAKEQVSQILESITDGFIAFDGEWRFTYLNREGAKILGCLPEELLGKNLWQEFPELANTSFGQLYQRVVAEGIPLELEDYYPPFKAWFAARAYPSKEGMSLYCRNITVRKQAEEERNQLLVREQAARAEAEAANRIKDEFLAVLSHELRTPLNPILGWSKLLRSRKLDEATTTRAIETIERNAKLQTQLIEDLLDVSRILQGKLNLNICAVDLATIIKAAMETVNLSAQAKSIKIQMQLDPNVGQVLGDPNRLQQVLWNLLSNAIKFTTTGGRVELRLSEVNGLEGWKVEGSENNLQSATSYAQIEVCDTGCGIKPEFLPFVFDYFRQENSTTTRAFGGLGLGLAIVQHLVELHGGFVKADSPGEGLGATFTVMLPLSSSQPQTPERQEELDSSPNFQGMRILVVDDEEDTLELLVFSLEQYGAQVRSVVSATEALEVLVQWQPDLLLSDIGMPEVDGYMLIRQIRSLPSEQGGHIQAIALTAYAGQLNQQQILAAGFQRHVTKPVDPVELAAVISDLVAN